MPEQLIWTGSPSQLKNAPAFFFAALAALAIVIVSWVVYGWLPGVAFVVLPLLYGFARWVTVAAQRFDLTSERLLVTRGFLSRTIDSLELYCVKDLRILQPLNQRLFGLETIQLITSEASTPVVLIDHIPSSIHLSDKIRTQVEACRVAKGTREIEME